VDLVADRLQLLDRRHAVGRSLDHLAEDLLLEAGTRTMKNSSKFDETIARNLSRSYSGSDASRARRAPAR